MVHAEFLQRLPSFTVYLLTICKVCPLGEAQLMAVLCLTGIHGPGISGQTIKARKDMASFTKCTWNQQGGCCDGYQAPFDWNGLTRKGIFKQEGSGSNPKTYSYKQDFFF